MLQLMVIADDLTGALDTGVQFASHGVSVRVVTRLWNRYDCLDSNVEVLVMDAETRHLSEADAYRTVYEIALNAKKNEIPYIYKKTDSVLRGNIGSELKALKDAANVNVLPFIPAFPKMGRITRHGVHFVDGRPVSESIFGKDPYEPVEHSYIPDIIRQQTELEVHVAENEWNPAIFNWNTNGVVVFDAEDDEQLKNTAAMLDEIGMLKVTAGCAGFAAFMAPILGLTGRRAVMPELTPGLLVVCGSVNPVTQKQLDAAEGSGFIRIRLTPQQKMADEYWDSTEGLRFLNQINETCCKSECCIIDTNDMPGEKETEWYARNGNLTVEETRKTIVATLGRLLKELVNRDFGKTMFITGGDTLLGFMESMEIDEMEPICEIAPGTVLSQFNINGGVYQVISKSGGFGNEELLVELAEKTRRGTCYADPI